MPVPAMSWMPTASAGRQSFSSHRRNFTSKARSETIPAPVVPFSRSLTRKVVSSQGRAWKPRNQNRRWCRKDAPASTTPSGRKRALRISINPTPP